MQQQRAQIFKKACHVPSCSPLSDGSILQQVLNFVGAGHWLFVATVDKSWRDAYARSPAVCVKSFTKRMGPCTVECVRGITLLKAIFGSASRVRLAHDLGVQLSKADDP